MLALLAGVGAYSTASKVRLMSAAILAAFIFVFPIADAYRRSQSPDLSDLGLLNSMTSGDFDAFAQVNNTIRYVLDEGVTWGWQALGVLLFWIPRNYWPTKPVDTGIFLADYRGYQFQNLSAPIWSELFINGGWIMLITGMLLLGVYIRKRDDNSINLEYIGYRAFGAQHYSAILHVYFAARLASSGYGPPYRHLQLCCVHHNAKICT